MTEHREEAALAFEGGIVWLAYRTTGKREGLYLEGWDTDGKSGSELGSLMMRVIDSQFAGLWSSFVRCDQVFLDEGMPNDLLVVMEASFSRLGMTTGRVRRSGRTPEQLGSRWLEALGEPFDESLPGYLTALSVLDSVHGQHCEV